MSLKAELLITNLTCLESAIQSKANTFFTNTIHETYFQYVTLRYLMTDNKL